MAAVVEKQPDGTIKLAITIPLKEVAKTREEIIEAQVKTAAVPGFRKGKAPKKMVEERISKDKLSEEILKKLLPTFYMQAIQEHSIRPIVSPKIHVSQVDDDKDWQFEALICEIPVVELGDYKKEVKDVTAKSKIVLPGKEKTEPKLEDIIQAVLKTAKVTVPALLIEQEVDRQLAQMLDEVKMLGLTLDQYLATTGKKPEELRTQYAEKAQNDIKLEFILQKIAETEKITVDEKEIAEAIMKAKDENERKNLEAQRYLLASILRQQKTLDFLRKL